MPRKSIAGFPAFPMPQSHAGSLEESYMPGEDGMSYRQWLIGQLANGLASNPQVASDNVAALAIQLADELIERIDT